MAILIKRDGTVCGNKCWLPEGCYRHWKLYEKNSKKRPCLFSGCEFPTDADSGYCHDHSASIHSHNYRMRQKRKAEALQLAKTSELFVEAVLGKIAWTSASLPVKKLQLFGINV